MVNIDALPIMERKLDILEALSKNQVVIVEGETGSGKTTGIPQFLFEAGYSDFGIIGVTEPRRLVAISTAKYVADQLDVEFGNEVGYQIRFDDYTCHGTKIKFMTDGIILREFQVDPDLSKYSVIMVDEAHERSINIDFTLGLLKDLMARRPEIKIVVASATIDTKKFSDYFGGSPIINVSGRTYPVEIEYAPDDVPDVFEEIANKIETIHRQKDPGDILVFLSGVEEISRTKDEIEKLGLSDIVIVACYGMQSPEKQQEIFTVYTDKRKVVLATNIAETSITIDGIVYVIDPGIIKQMNYSHASGIASLDEAPHSQAGCDQRAGRAGRTRPGFCNRLYTEDDFNRRPKYTEPEIMRSSLASVVLAMEDIGINDIPNFDFIDSPDKEAFKEAYMMLQIFGAIKKGERGLTEIGKAMARLPLEPHLSRMLLQAYSYGCLEEVARVAACLSVRNIFVVPREDDKRIEAQIAHQPFKRKGSDALALLNVLNQYELRRASGIQDARGWAYENFLNWKNLDEALKIKLQLIRILSDQGYKISSCSDESQVDRAVVSGLIYNLIYHEYRGSHCCVFKNLDRVFIHPGSALFRQSSAFIVAASMVETSRLYASFCVRVRPEWLAEFAPSLCMLSVPTLESYNPETGIGQAKRTISFFLRKEGQHREAGEMVYEVERDKAAKLQQDAVKKAVLDGCELLKLRRISAGYDEIWTDQYGRQFRVGMLKKPEEGKQYCCEVKRFLFDRLYLTIKFEVFDLDIPTATNSEISALSLKLLATKFNQK